MKSYSAESAASASSQSPNEDAEMRVSVKESSRTYQRARASIDKANTLEESKNDSHLNLLREKNCKPDRFIRDRALQEN